MKRMLIGGLFLMLLPTLLSAQRMKIFKGAKIIPVSGDRSSTLHLDVHILHDINPRSDIFIKALADSITSVNVMPGWDRLQNPLT